MSRRATDHYVTSCAAGPTVHSAQRKASKTIGSAVILKLY